MLITLSSVATWQTLRAAARSKKPLAGRDLRLSMSRKTADGSFLTDLVRLGLLEVVGAGGDPFDATYRLTDRGRHAAEFGEYEMEWEEFKTATAAEPPAEPRKVGRPGHKKA